MPGAFSITHLVILGLILLVIFGPKRLPELGRSLGQGFRELKNSLNEDTRVTTVHEITAAETAPVVAADAPAPQPADSTHDHRA